MFWDGIRPENLGRDPSQILGTEAVPTFWDGFRPEIMGRIPSRFSGTDAGPENRAAFWNPAGPFG